MNKDLDDDIFLKSLKRNLNGVEPNKNHSTGEP